MKKQYHIEFNSAATPPVNNRFIVDIQGRFPELVHKRATFTYTNLIIQTNGAAQESKEDLRNFPLLAVRSNLPAPCAAKSNGSPYTAIAYLDHLITHSAGADTYVYLANQASHHSVETVIPSSFEIFLTTDMQGYTLVNPGTNDLIVNLAIQVAE